MSKKKVLYILHNHPVIRPGGSESYALELYEAMRGSEEFEPVLMARLGNDVAADRTPHAGAPFSRVNEDENHEPFELFTSMGKAGGCAASQTEAISRLVSLALRSRIDIEEVIEQLKGISCHNHAFGPDGKILSCADGIAKGMEKYIGKFKPNGNGNGNLGGDERSKSTGKTRVIAADKKTGSVTGRIMGACPDCGGILDFSEGCVVCHGCGYSKC